MFPGIIYSRNGRAARTAPRATITDLDSLPWPDRDVLVHGGLLQGLEIASRREFGFLDHGSRMSVSLRMVFVAKYLVIPIGSVRRRTLWTKC